MTITMTSRGKEEGGRGKGEGGRGQADVDDDAHLFGSKIRGVEFGDAIIRRLRMRRLRPHSRELEVGG